DPRSEAPAMPRPEPVAAPVAQPPASDPATEAEARGHARGLAEGLARARAEAEADRAAQAALQLAFAHLDTQLAEQLRQRLTDTVVALCEHALAPLAVDEAALALRVRRAVAMLARADDERVICLHPADLTLVRAALPADWTFRPDPRLERGALRVETQGGGVEDGPREWRRAIAEALDIGGPEALEDEA
ncbi:MAG TPA: FliH/SctL family protein, partial [Novosphingobium sp.]|nr:FliH/SctL family protein [Novosphingobium sp.]